MCRCPCCLKHTYLQTQTHISNVNILWINTHGAVNIVQFACVARTLYVLLYTPGTQFKFCTTDLIWGSLISLSLPLSLSLSLFHTFFHMPPYLHPQSLPPSLPSTPPALPPSAISLFAVAKGQVRRLEYVDASSSARERPAFAPCRGETDHRGENRSVRLVSCQFLPGIDQGG